MRIFTDREQITTNSVTRLKWLKCWLFVFKVAASMAPPGCSLCGGLQNSNMSANLCATWGSEEGLKWRRKNSLGYWRLCQTCFEMYGQRSPPAKPTFVFVV